MLCDSVAQVNDICNMNGVTVKMVVLKSFKREGLDLPLCKISTFTVILFMFFFDNNYILYKCFREIFFSESLANFSLSQTDL